MPRERGFVLGKDREGGQQARRPRAMDVMDSQFRFNSAHLAAMGEQLRSEYSYGDPYPHCVIDGFLPEAVLERIVEEFPDPRHELWERRATKNSFKLSCNDLDDMGQMTRVVLEQFNSRAMLRFLEQLTSIDHLIPDALFEGGGLHQILPGGFLKIHADFNKHPEWNLDRRLNAILFLNRDWSEEYGGHFELWDQQMTKCRKKVLPVFNRLVVFTSTDTSYHGHPDPLRCPPAISRKSIATYYYTNGRPTAEQTGSHSTIYKLRPKRDWSARRFLRPLFRAIEPSPETVAR
jgi:Rps23 Pro-64 3,4-dihydroxylase Tpa1-like proline 4-hydroxylase